MSWRWIALFALAVVPLAEAQTVFVRGTDSAIWMKEGEWGSLGGIVNGAPDACRAGGDVVVVARGSDNAVWTKRRSGSTWSDWSSLGGEVTSDVSVACLPDGSGQVFARGSDLALWTRNTAESSAWSSLGGQLDGSPEAASSSSGVLDVVLRGTDQAVWHLRFDGRAWSEWRSLGGRTATDPTITRLTADRVEIFVTRSDGTVQQGTLGAGAVTWTPLPGGIVRGSPDAVSNRDGRLYLIARGTDDAVWSASYDGTNWGAWTNHGGTATSDPSGVMAGGLTATTTTPTPTVRAATRRYDLMVTGFSVHRQSADDLLNRDGWGDEVFLQPTWYHVQPDGSVVYAGGSFSGLYGQVTGSSNVQAGMARPDGGLQTGDTHPAGDPMRGANAGPGAVTFRGVLTQGSGGVVIVPSIWEWDNRDELLRQYWTTMHNARTETARRAAPLFASLRGGDLSRFVRDGSEVGLERLVVWPGAQGPTDYPFGVVRTDAGMVFSPPVILLTYEVAEYLLSRRLTVPVISRSADGTSAIVETTAEPGVFSIRYADRGDGFAADYTVYFRLVPIG